jgi:hypothetical protein
MRRGAGPAPVRLGRRLYGGQYSENPEERRSGVGISLLREPPRTPHGGNLTCSQRGSPCPHLSKRILPGGGSGGRIFARIGPGPARCPQHLRRGRRGYLVSSRTVPDQGVCASWVEKKKWKNDWSLDSPTAGFVVSGGVARYTEEVESIAGTGSTRTVHMLRRTRKCPFTSIVAASAGRSSRCWWPRARLSPPARSAVRRSWSGSSRPSPLTAAGRPCRANRAPARPRPWLAAGAEGVQQGSAPSRRGDRGVRPTQLRR